MTAARSSYKQRQQIRELSFNLAMSEARLQNAREKARVQRARAAERDARLQPLLAAAGYGPHGAADWIRAEAKAVRARGAAVRSTEHAGLPDLRGGAPGGRGAGQRRVRAARGIRHGLPGDIPVTGDGEPGAPQGSVPVTFQAATPVWTFMPPDPPDDAPADDAA
jgi:hypothetical protein